MRIQRSVLSIAGAALMAISAAACGSSKSSTTTPPAVLSTVPAAAATSVATNAVVTATFSGPMDGTTLTQSTFTLTSGAPAVAVAGAVTSAGATATFTPAAALAADTLFTATITTGAKSAGGVAMAAAHQWTFTTGSTAGTGTAVALGSAGDFAILAKSGISTVPTSHITGDIGVSPATASAITGFELTLDGTGVFSTSTQVTGQVFAAAYAAPTPANLTAAVAAMGLASTDAAGRAPTATELGAGNIGGLTIAPGVYKWGAGLLIPTDVTLDGSATDVWIFQVAQGLTVSSAAKVLLAGGALPKNVFWQVTGAVALGTTSHLEGIVLGSTSIALATGATVNGRLLAQTAVTLDGSTVVAPAP